MRDAQSGIEIKIVGLLVRQGSSAVVEAEKAAKSSVRTDAVASKISEMLRSFGENLRNFGEIGT
jgi:hypothetical protein